MHNPKVSVIVPIYNAEVFLPSTIKSIQNQTYSNLEIILVNDCSTDNSLKLCNKFAASDSRIKVVDKKINEGDDFARFTGIEVATGDYFTFLDADDRFTFDALETWLKYAKYYNADIVYANYVRVYSERFRIKRINEFDSKFTERVISGKEKEELFISFFGVNIVPVAMWGNLFKRKLFKESLKCSGLKFGADLVMAMQLYNRADSIIITSHPVILYRWGGVTAKYQPKFLASAQTLFQRKMEFLKTIDYPRARETSIIELVNCLASEVRQLAEYFPNQAEENIQKLRDEMSDPLYECFDEVKDNPYFVKGNVNEAVCHRNAEEAYNIATVILSTPKAKLRRLLKRGALAVLRHVKL